jgi:hypothetical protein
MAYLQSCELIGAGIQESITLDEKRASPLSD